MSTQESFIRRTFWINLIEKAWLHRSIVWLTGVRRVGKTVLCENLQSTEYYDCDLPRVRRRLEDPEEFLKKNDERRIVLDEIHRLNNPSELLKIAADHFPYIKVIATGSSTLGASKKFQDTLTGRKVQIHITPMLYHEGLTFGNQDLEHRMLFGGLPPFFLASQLPTRDFREWLESYWARDIQEDFKLEKRSSFLKFTELIFAQSGGQFEATKFTAPCEVSRTTISNYLSVLETTHVARVIRPYNSHRSTEIISAPKVYGFDSGLVCYGKGWDSLRDEDLGHLWEHIVLNELCGQLQLIENIHYWRDKRDHEIDFIFKRRTSPPAAIECKMKADNFDPSALKSFRRIYQEGKNFVVASDIERGEDFTRNFGDLRVSFVGLEELITQLGPSFQEELDIQA